MGRVGRAGRIFYMANANGEYPTVIGSDARIKGELYFEKGVRIEGTFEGEIKSKGSLAIAEGAKVHANIEAANLRLDGECKGNVQVSEKLQLMATARMEGDLRTSRLEIADGAIFVGNVIVGHQGGEATRRSADANAVRPQPQPQMRPQPRPQEVPAGANQ